MIKKMKDSEEKRFVIYTRCSTDDQAQGEYTTLDAQAHHCKNMIDAFGYKLAKIGKDGIINDDGFSGKDLNRPGIQKILEDVNKKKRSFDGIIFFRLDRLTRNPRDLYALIDLFRDHDIDFISVRENLDSSTAIGRVVIGILGLLSAFERELTGERVKASAMARVRQGKWVGGKLPYGYKLVPHGERLPNGVQPNKIEIDENVGPKLQIIWELAAQNKSLTQIGMELDKRKIYTTNGKMWRRQGISTIIKSPFYKGYIKYSGEMHKGNHEAIVDEKLWERANRILVAKLPGHKFVKKVKEYKYLLEGLMKCGECGSHMMSCYSGNGNGRKFYYYECGRSKQALGCSTKRISATILDKALVDYFKRASEDQEIINRAIGNAILEAKMKLETLEDRMHEKEKKLNTLKHESEKLLNLAMDGMVTQGSTYKAKMTALETEIATIETELSKLQAQRRIAQMNANSDEFIHHNLRLAMQYLDKAPPEAQKLLMQAMIKDIVIYNEDKMAINMFISDSLQENLPKDLLEIMPQKVKRPTNNSEALTANSQSSADCLNWLREEMLESISLRR